MMVFEKKDRAPGASMQCGWRTALVLGAFCSLGGCRQAPPVVPAKPAILTIQNAPSHTLKGWGIFPCTIQNDRPNAHNFTIFRRPNAQKLIFGELGMTMMRSEILPGSYDARHDDGSLDTRYLDESLVRQMQIARRFGIEKTVLSIWSPPAIFKTPATTFGTDPKTKRVARLHPKRELDYCRFIARVLDYLTKTKKLRAPIALSIQNEPSYAAQQWKSTLYDSAQWRRVLILIRRVLNESGYAKVQLIGPECGSYQESVDYVGGASASVFQKAEFRNALDGFAFHGYTRFSRKPEYSRNLQAVAQTARRLKKDIWMSEYSLIAQKPNALEHALDTSQRLAREMTFIPCNYWFWWQGWYPVHPKNEVLLTGLNDKKLHISKTYFVLQKLWHNAPAGSDVYRVDSSDTDLKGDAPPAVQTVAFRFGKRLTMLLINPTTQTKALRIVGLRGKSATPFLTDSSRNMQPQNSITLTAQPTLFSLPPQSIVVLVAQ